MKNLCESAKSAANLTLCDLTIAFWQGSCVFTSNNVRFAILLLRIGQPSQNSHMLANIFSNTVTVRSVVIMVVGLQVWGYGRQQGSSEEGYTQLRCCKFNTESYSVQQMYMYLRGHNQIEAFPTKYSYEALTSNLPLLKLITYLLYGGYPFML